MATACHQARHPWVNLPSPLSFDCRAVLPGMTYHHFLMLPLFLVFNPLLMPNVKWCRHVHPCSICLGGSPCTIHVKSTGFNRDHLHPQVFTSYGYLLSIIHEAIDCLGDAYEWCTLQHIEPCWSYSTWHKHTGNHTFSNLTQIWNITIFIQVLGK